jgi:hypothetical protein
MSAFDGNEIDFMKFDPPRAFKFKRLRETPPRFEAEGDTWRFAIWHSKSKGTLMMKTHRKGADEWKAHTMPLVSISLDKDHGINHTVEIRRHEKYKAWVEINLTDYPKGVTWIAVVDYFTHVYGIVPGLEGINMTVGGDNIIR